METEPTPSYQLIYSDDYRYNGYTSVHIAKVHRQYPVPSLCYLQVWKSEKQTVVIATELGENYGMSITNAYEYLAEKIVEDFQLIPEKTIFIERYTANSYEAGNGSDTYDKVSLAWSGTEANLLKWERMSQSDVQNLFT